MITAEKPSEILRRLGHTKGGLQDLESKKVCTAGAVYCSVLGEDELLRAKPLEWPKLATIEKHLRSIMDHLKLNELGSPLLAVGVWNDVPERTADECIAALEACGL